MGTYAISILTKFWRELSVLGLVAFIYLANTFYVEKIKLERDLANSRVETIQTVLDAQIQRIKDSAERVENIVQSEMQTLDDRLDRLSNRQRQQIHDLLSVEVPDACSDDINDFLIRMIDELRWEP